MSLSHHTPPGQPPGTDQEDTMTHAPADLTPLSFVLGIAVFVAAVALLAALHGAVRWTRPQPRAGIPRAAASDATPVEGRRRARLAARTIIDAESGAVPVEARRTR